MPQRATQSAQSAAEPVKSAWTLPAEAYLVYEDYLRGKTMQAIARERDLDRQTVKRYIDALLKEQSPARAVKRERLRSETLAKLRKVYQHAWGLIEEDPTNTAALNVVVRTLREEAKLHGLYNDVNVSVEHSGAVEIRVVYKNDWRGAGPPAPTHVAERVVDAAAAEDAE